MDELLNKKYKLEDQSEDIKNNLNILFEKSNKLRNIYGKPMIVTSGLRTTDDHLRIYKEKAEKAGIPFDESEVPMRSKHLYGQAVDIFDPNADLYNWCLSNEKILVEIGLWLEHRQGVWQHFQIVPFNSYKSNGTIWFIP
jgi:uncharacterized protein YcbK (DUF882 family)